jgi:hypothetical protein
MMSRRPSAKNPTARSGKLDHHVPERERPRRAAFQRAMLPRIGGHLLD